MHWLRIAPATIDDLRLMLRVSRREVEEAVESLRLAGEPIVASNDGLRLTENPDELAAYVEARRRRAVSIYLGTRALRRTTARMREVQDEQNGLTLFGDVAA
jgi:hypothetical protein